MQTANQEVHAVSAFLTSWSADHTLCRLSGRLLGWQAAGSLGSWQPGVAGPSGQVFLPQGKLLYVALGEEVPLRFEVSPRVSNEGPLASLCSAHPRGPCPFAAAMSATLPTMDEDWELIHR